MSTGDTNRTCGRCGATVGAVDVTCAACGALLAAYEPPAGATSVAEAPAPAPTPPATPVLTVPPPPERSPVRPAGPATPVEPADGPVVPSTPVPTRTEPPARAATLPPAPAREKAQPAPARRDPPRRPDPAPSPRNAPTRPAPTPQPPAQGRGTPRTSIGRLALGVLIVIGMMVIVRFGPVPVLIVGVVLISLFGSMRSAAKASGRRTTTMPGPDAGRSRRR